MSYRVLCKEKIFLDPRIKKFFTSMLIYIMVIPQKAKKYYFS